jgi:hypothetical protein
VKPPATPRAWAGRFTQILNASFGDSPARFPVDVRALALDYTRQAFPQEPITVVQGEMLGRFEGCLRLIHPGASKWGILHNIGVTPGRARFTLGHEFGHYLLHRHLAGPSGIFCSTDDIARGQVGGANIEREADDFAAALLMPLDDFRRQIPPDSKVDLHSISACADRYGTSLIATVLKWLSYTERRAVLVVARDGYVDWSRSSDAALKTRAFLRAKSGPPIEVPEKSLMANPDLLVDMRAGITQGPAVWFGEESREMTLVADAYDFRASLILLGDAPDRIFGVDDEDDPIAVPVDERLRSRF